MWLPVCTPVALYTIQLHASIQGKAMEDGVSAHMGDPDEPTGF